MSTTVSIAPSPELLRFAQRRSRMAKTRDEIEQRSEERETYVTPALLLPVDSSLQVVGDAIHAVTRDISAGGIGIIAEQLPHHRLFAAHFHVSDEMQCLLLRAKWTQHDGPFEAIGFRALAVLQTLPLANAPTPHARRAYEIAASLAT